MSLWVMVSALIVYLPIFSSGFRISFFGHHVNNFLPFAITANNLFNNNLPFFIFLLGQLCNSIVDIDYEGQDLTPAFAHQKF
ncbi:hypothetical protein HKBW3S42_01110 [Candidatus Hakubella thermalkaliphila]|uniref:Uncharacterized protein n=1 Tax=Candidatus Hakubella thermalkaliphila TaxID=2754717 RepID=A0A6V8PJG1_9ACTN|nr:hypothetical protein HKBW3S42_01110 [Candidatus Hakubella thermalkaliphila]